jgi:hypothetical protein
MNKLIRKILREESEDFNWANEVDPLQSFEDYFYGRNKRGFTPGDYIKRDIDWWLNWCDEVIMAHVVILDDIQELTEMVNDLVNPRDGSEKYRLLAKDVYSYLSPLRSFKGKNMLQSSASDIHEAYEYFGQFAEENNLTILETLDVFKQWLERRKEEGKPLHKES